MISGHDKSADLCRLFIAVRIVKFDLILGKMEMGLYKECRKLLERP